MQQEMYAKKCKNSCRHVIQNNSGTSRKFLQLPHRRRLEDIERSKKYKTSKVSFPFQRNADQRDQLASNLVDYHELRILHRGRLSHASGGRYASHGNQNCQRDGQRSA